MTFETGGYTGSGKCTPFPVQSGCVIPKRDIEKLGGLPSVEKLAAAGIGKASFVAAWSVERLIPDTPYANDILEAVKRQVGE